MPLQRFVLSLLLASLLLAPSLVSDAAPCEFRLGFKTLHDLIPDVVGNCLEDEHHSADNGDALQRTTGGLLVWRKADNWTAFTDGTTTWIDGPDGLVSRPNSGPLFPWEANVSASPTPAPNIPPAAMPLVQRAIDDAAQRAGVDRGAVQVLTVEARDWPDSSLGCPKPGMAYAQVITPGYLIVLHANGQRFEYHTDRGQRVELCS